MRETEKGRGEAEGLSGRGRCWDSLEKRPSGRNPAREAASPEGTPEGLVQTGLGPGPEANGPRP